MRQIKFRGRRKIYNVWVYGFYAKWNSSVICGSDGTEFSVHEKTVGQFTGMMDIKEFEIYEGDLLYVKAEDTNAPNGKFHESKLPVFFENGSFWVDESFSKDRSAATLLAEFEEPLVCGSVFDEASTTKCPECFCVCGRDELDMFGGLCESCNEEL